MQKVNPKGEDEIPRPSDYRLKDFRLFSNLGDEDLEYLEKMTLVKKFKRHQMIYLPSDSANAIYLLRAGRVKISRIAENGREFTLEIIGPGKMFGELDILERGHRDTVAEVLEDATIGLLRPADFETVLHKNPNMMLLWTKLIGQRLKKTESRIEDLVFREVPVRLARLLLELSNEFRESSEKGILFPCRITHQELANLSGSTRETVSAALSDFKREGLIQLAYRSITILDHERFAMVQ
ncbi:Crp/Fnr family transcriptional regulator [Nitrospira defluvii]|nr:Crp/Fnr family transcriptional regulator [Nitrospira defluvii]